MPSRSNRAAAPPPSLRPRLLKERRDDLVIMLVRMPDLYAEARLLLKPEHFNLGGELPHQALVRQLYALVDSGTYAPGAVPLAALSDAVAVALSGLSDQQLREPWVGELINRPDEPGCEGLPPGLLWRCYHKDLGEYTSGYAYETLRLFLEERAVADRAAALVTTLDGRIPQHYPSILNNLAADAMRIGSIGDDPFTKAFPDQMVLTPLIYVPTGCGWVDTMMIGQVACDVNGIIGVWGGGKTTAVIQLLVSLAKRYYAEALRTGQKPKVAIFFSYEESLEQLRPRVWSCAAAIRKRKLERMASVDELTRRGKLDPYEIAWYRERNMTDFAHYNGEYERFFEAQKELENTFRLVDMRKGGRGGGWVDEIAGYLMRFQEANDVEIGVVGIDYVNAMCRRHVDTLEWVGNNTLREKIQRTPLEVEEKIARKFHCTVWLAQQFSGEANKKAPTAKMMMADASEARSFGENLVFCLAFGAKDEESGCTQITYVKGRRLDIQGRTGIVRIDGDLGRIITVDDRYVVDGNKIVLRAVAAHFQGETAPAPPAGLALDGGAISEWEP